MAPAADLARGRDVGVDIVVGWPIGRTKECVVDALGVGLDVAGEALEQLPDRGAGLARQILEEDVIAVGDLDEEVGNDSIPPSKP